MAQTVLKVTIACDKCKTKLLKSISSLQGVDKMEVDAAKGTLTITGSVDPYEVIVKARKAGQHVEVMTIGPPKKSEPDVKCPPCPCPCPCPYPYPYSNPYPTGEIAFIELSPYHEPNPFCSIM